MRLLRRSGVTVASTDGASWSELWSLWQACDTWFTTIDCVMGWWLRLCASFDSVAAAPPAQMGSGSASV